MLMDGSKYIKNYLQPIIPIWMQICDSKSVVSNGNDNVLVGDRLQSM
jgi:hypothetical protein